jgi:hypothetical protein
MIVPKAAAARDIATSPSGCACRWYAIGATMIGAARSAPRTVRSVVTVVTSRSSRGRSVQRRYALTFSRSVHSSPAPAAKYASGPGGRSSAARRS